MKLSATCAIMTMAITGQVASAISSGWYVKWSISEVGDDDDLDANSCVYHGGGPVQLWNQRRLCLRGLKSSHNELRRRSLCGPNPSYFNTKEECCHEQKFYFRDFSDCMRYNYDDSFKYEGSFKYYVDYVNNRCVQDCRTVGVFVDGIGGECKLPGGIVDPFEIDLYEDAASCCAAKLSHATPDLCESNSDPDSAAAGTGMYYADSTTGDGCVIDRDDCTSVSATVKCGRISDPSVRLYATVEECCANALRWVDKSLCKKETTGFPTGSWFPMETISSGGCAKDCIAVEPPSPNGGPAAYCNNDIPDSIEKVFDSPEACCAAAFGSMNPATCVQNSFAGEKSPGSYRYRAEESHERCVQDCDAIDGPNGPCKIPGGIVTNPFVALYETAMECCTAKLGYLNEDYCVSNSDPWSLGTGKYYAKSFNGICVLDRETCPVMTSGVQCERNTNGWTQLYDSLEACCENEIAWVDRSWCVRTSSDQPSGMWFLPSPFSEKCSKDCTPSEPLLPSGQLPLYCAEQIPSTFFEFYNTLEECCTDNLSYAKEACVATSMGEDKSVTDTSTSSEQYFVDWFRFKCVKNCIGADPCGGLANVRWDHLYGSSAECCAKGLGWMSFDDCFVGPKFSSTPLPTIGQTLREDLSCIFDDFLLQASFENNNGLACYNNVALSTVPGGPTTAQMLVMFADGQFIQSDQGNVFMAYTGSDICGFPKAEYSSFPIPLAKGLYQVIDDVESCVEFRLIYETSSIGQIVPVARKNLAPIEVVGVDKQNNKIYGYYPDAGSPGGLWQRKSTLWGDAVDGTLAWGPEGEIGGVSTNGKLFNLWGEFESNFNYAKHDDINCSTLPFSAANIEWLSPYSNFRGLYCIDHDGIFTKYTWNSDSNGGPASSTLDWTPAKKIMRLTESSNIYGISSSGGVVTLAGCEGCGGEDVLSRLIRVQPHSVREVAGIDSEPHFFSLKRVSGACDILSYVYRGTECFASWDVKEMSTGDLFNIGECSKGTLGSYDGHAYLLHKTSFTHKSLPPKIRNVDVLYRLDVVGGVDMFHAIEIQRSDTYII